MEGCKIYVSPRPYPLRRIPDGYRGGDIIAGKIADPKHDLQHGPRRQTDRSAKGNTHYSNDLSGDFTSGSLRSTEKACVVVRSQGTYKCTYTVPSPRSPCFAEIHLRVLRNEIRNTTETQIRICKHNMNQLSDSSIPSLPFHSTNTCFKSSLPSLTSLIFTP